MGLGAGSFFAAESFYDEPEDYVGLSLEYCTILDPDYTGCESLAELVARYGIDLTDEDVRFFRESHGGIY